MRIAMKCLWMLCAWAGLAVAQDYPSRPITLVNGFAPGGNADLVARLVAQKMTDVLGQQMVVENRAGAGGLLANDYVAKSAPDGYRLILLSGAFPTQVALLPKLPFDPQRDFSWVGMLITYPLVVTVPADSPFKSLEELVRAAKASPRKLNYPSPGNGSLFHLATEVFSAGAGVDLTHVPFKGGSQQVTELIAGRLDVMFDTLSVVQPHVRAGKLRALAVTSPQRMSQLPGVPAVSESLAGYEADSFLALAGPAGLSAGVVERLNTAIRKVLEQPDIRQRFAELGGEGRPGTPADLGRYVANATAKWKTVAQARNIRAD
jgi:tripartite-type tricarboxylate transporter receptor subunit TctC